MANELTITVNGRLHRVAATADTPLLYVLRNELGMNGPQFGCGNESCGACTVLLGAKAVKSCKLPISDVAGQAITTLEGLSADGALHPVQRGFIEEQATQCGYCANGMIMAAAAFLWQNPHPNAEQIRQALDANLCRCGAHPRILRAVRRAAEMFEQEGA